MADDDPNGVTVSKSGWTAKIKGAQVWALILAIVVIAAAYREFDRLDKGTAARTNEAVQVLRDEHAAILTTLERAIREIQIQNWLQSTPIDERPRLIPPDGITERIERLPPRRGRP